MTTLRHPQIAGVVPAIYTPFKPDLSVDEESLRRLTDRVVSVDGVGAVFCTGHAGEVASLSREERKRVIACVVEATAGRTPVMAGIYSDSLTESIEHTRDAREAGASVITIFPPNVFFGGATRSPDVPFAWFEAIARAVDIAICIFQFPPSSGLGYTTETLVRLAALPQVVAVKEGSGAPDIYENNVIALSALDPAVSVLTSNNEWWLADLALGGNGILSGSGPVLAAEQVALWRAMQAGDLPAARAVQARIRPLLKAFYRAPSIDMHNRMKNALVMMGVLPDAAVRPPLTRLDGGELAEIRAALEQAGLL